MKSYVFGTMEAETLTSNLVGEDLKEKWSFKLDLDKYKLK